MCVAFLNISETEKIMSDTLKTSWLWPPPEPVGVDVTDIAGNPVKEKFPVFRVFCVGRNYEAHAVEMNAEIDREAPFYFTKAPSTIACNVKEIAYPSGTTNFHHEVELVIALGGDAFRVAEEDALQVIYGYACGIDLTRRDLQNKAKADRKPWDLSKDIEQGAVISAIKQWPVGHLPDHARIELRVNGEQRQDASLAQMVWKIPEIISHLSNYYHLKAGDLIYTGTPAGVGALEVGDQVDASIEDVGELSLRITA